MWAKAKQSLQLLKESEKRSEELVPINGHKSDEEYRLNVSIDSAYDSPSSSPNRSPTASITLSGGRRHSDEFRGKPFNIKGVNGRVYSLAFNSSLPWMSRSIGESAQALSLSKSCPSGLSADQSGTKWNGKAFEERRGRNEYKVERQRKRQRIFGPRVELSRELSNDMIDKLLTKYIANDRMATNRWTRNRRKNSAQNGYNRYREWRARTAVGYSTPANPNRQYVVWDDTTELKASSRPRPKPTDEALIKTMESLNIKPRNEVKTDPKRVIISTKSSISIVVANKKRNISDTNDDSD